MSAYSHSYVTFDDCLNGDEEKAYDDVVDLQDYKSNNESGDDQRSILTHGEALHAVPDLLVYSSRYEFASQ